MVEEKKEADVFTANEHLVREMYTSAATEYSPEWMEHCTVNAYDSLCQPDGIRRPFALTMALFGGKTSEFDMFEIVKQSSWKVKCFVFENNENMKKWMDAVGHDIVIDHSFVQ